MSDNTYSRSWEKLSTSSNPRQVQQIVRMNEISKALKEYRRSYSAQGADPLILAYSTTQLKGLTHDQPDEALLLQEAIFKMPKTDATTLSLARRWFDKGLAKRGSRSIANFEDVCSKRLNDEADLLVTHTEHNTDLLFKFVSLPLIRLFCLVRQLSSTMKLF